VDDFVENVNLAIPHSKVKRVVSQLLECLYVTTKEVIVHKMVLQNIKQM